MSVLFRIRTGEKEAAQKEIESWKAAHDHVNSASEVAGLVEEALLERDQDETFLQRVLERARGADRGKIDEAHQFIQEYCRRSIRIHDLIREFVQEARQTGHAVARADELDRATADYLTWQEDYPDLLLLAYQPVAEAIGRRIKELPGSVPRESNWRQLFAEEGETSTAE